MSTKFPITLEGFKRLQEELEHLKKVERPKISSEIAAAREHGDLKENAEYHAAREKQGFTEARISELEDKTARAEVIDVSKLGGDVIKFGAKVTFIEEETEKEFYYQIVGEYEADIRNNRISIISPIAKALIGKSKDDYIEVTTPGGTKGYEILKVEY